MSPKRRVISIGDTIPFGGQVAYARFYDRALTDEEVEAELEELGERFGITTTQRPSEEE
jgi:hypothetical protein